MLHAAHGPVHAPALLRSRAEKDRWLRTSGASPIPPAARSSFSGLAYYPPDARLRFAGLRLLPRAASVPGMFHLPTSDGQARRAEVAGRFDLPVAGWTCSLHAYRLPSTPPGVLFVPFQDATSGVESYAAGRYLDLEVGVDGTFTLDFNLAYLPWCAFSASYSCPLTPAENRLSVPIRAGERMPGLR